MRCWYLVYTKHGEEFRAQLNLERQEFSTYLPKIHMPPKKLEGERRVVPFFPRYLFVEVNHERDDVFKIANTKGIVELVKFGNHAAQVSLKIIEEVKISEANMNKRTQHRVNPTSPSNVTNSFCSSNHQARVLTLFSALNETHNQCKTHALNRFSRV